MYYIDYKTKELRWIQSHGDLMMAYEKWRRAPETKELMARIEADSKERIARLMVKINEMTR